MFITPAFQGVPVTYNIRPNAKPAVLLQFRGDGDEPEFNIRFITEAQVLSYEPWNGPGGWAAIHTHTLIAPTTPRTILNEALKEPLEATQSENQVTVTYVRRKSIGASGGAYGYNATATFTFDTPEHAAVFCRLFNTTEGKATLKTLAEQA